MGDTVNATDASEVEATYKRYFPLLRAKCRRMLADNQEAQDVAQETLLRLWKGGLQGLPAPQLTRWLYRTSTRLAIDTLRQRARTGPAVESHAQSSDRPDTWVENQQLLQRLATRIPSDALELAILHRVDGLNQQELAEVIGTTDRTVRRRLEKLDLELQRLKEEQS